jgi:hypothetical protein
MFCQTKPESDVEHNRGEDAGLEDLDFRYPRWIIDHHRHSLIQKISKPKSSCLGVFGHNAQENAEHGRPDGSEHSYRINFSELQRLRLRQLQHKLVQHVIHLRYRPAEPPGWADDLRQYGKSNIGYYIFALYIIDRLCTNNNAPHS